MLKKCLLSFLVLLMLSTRVFAGPSPAVEPSTVEQPQPITTVDAATSNDKAGPAKPDDLYFSKDNPVLTHQEKEALSIPRMLNRHAVDPVQGKNGSISFLYGMGQPSIVCAVLQACDVALQAGEKVNNIELGDTARWTVTPAVSGSVDGSIQHLIIKPMDVGLSTSLVVTTDRRTYHLRLRSHRTEYMPQVSFTYPAEVEKKWAAIKAMEKKDHDQRTLPETGEYLGDLSFDYDISGNASWRPVRVYNDGRKTVIQMPSTMDQTEAPVLLVMRNDGSSMDDATMVNYRIQGDRYIVDTVFRKAIMIAGVGSDQQRLTITWRKEP